MSTVAALWAIYLLFSAFVGAAAKWLESPIPRAVFLAFILLPPFLMLPAFTSEKTVVPVDHALAIPPWSTGETSVRRHNPYLNDVTMQFVPWSKAVRVALKERSLPLRNRWNGCGMVLAANSQSAAFFPLSILGFAVPLAASFALIAAAKLLLSLTGTWLWLRALGVSPRSSLFGALAFSLSLTVTPWLLFPHTGVISLWPWALFAVELLRRPDWRPGFWCGLTVFTLWALAGHPESAASGAAFAVFWLAARWALGGLPDGVRVFRRLIPIASAALGLTAFLLLPQVLAILASNRIAHWGVFWAPHLSALPHGPVWVGGLITPLFPRALGDAIDSPMLPAGAASYPEMGLGYFGIVGWACVLLLLRAGSKRPAAERALLLPLLLAWSFAIGLWPFAELLALLPALKLIFPIRFFSWLALAGAAIAAFELDRLAEDLRAGRRLARLAPLLSAAVLASAAVAVYGMLRPQHVASGGLPGQQQALVLSLAALVGFAVVGLAGRRGVFPIALALACVNGAELYLQSERLYRFGSPHALFPPTPALNWLGSRPRPFRVLGDGPVLFPNSNVFPGLEEIRTHDPVERRDYVEFLDATAGYPPVDYFKHIGDPDAPAMDFLNVRYFVGMPGARAPGKRWKPVYAGFDAVIYENSAALPRVYAPESIRLVRAPMTRGGLPPSNAMTPFSSALPAIKAVEDWRSVAFLAAPAESNRWPSGRQPLGVEASDYIEGTNSASFTARNPSDREAILVASLVQDGGWSAEANGQPLDTAHANGPFLAIAIPPGEHRVRMRYVSPGFFTGSGVTVLSALVLLVVAWRRRPRARTGV